MRGEARWGGQDVASRNRGWMQVHVQRGGGQRKRRREQKKMQMKKEEATNDTRPRAQGGAACTLRDETKTEGLRNRAKPCISLHQDALLIGLPHLSYDGLRSNGYHGFFVCLLVGSSFAPSNAMNNCLSSVSGPTCCAFGFSSQWVAGLIVCEQEGDIRSSPRLLLSISCTLWTSCSVTGPWRRFMHRHSSSR